MNYGLTEIPEGYDRGREFLHLWMQALERHLRESFGSAGFRLVASEVIPQTIASGWSEYADTLAAGADSVLATRSRQEFEGGLAALRRHGANALSQPIVEPIDLFVFH